MSVVGFDLSAALTAFVLIFPVELPDKTFVVSLVLATRYRPLPVWIGVVAAFFVQTLVAVTAGGLLALLPRQAVVGAAAVLFAVGAVVLFRSAARADAEEAAQEEELTGRLAASGPGPDPGGGPGDGAEPEPAEPSPYRAALVSFGMLFAAEWGDLSQLLTAGLVVRTAEPVSVFVGAWLSLAVVAGIAVLVGKTLTRYVRLATIRRIGGGVCAVLAVLSALEVVGAEFPF